MITKHIQLTLNFKVTASDTPQPPDDSQDWHEYMERQKRLLQVVLTNQEHLHSLLRYQVTSHLEGMNWRKWDELLLGDNAEIEDVLAPVIAALSEADQEYFKDAEEHGVFYENVEEMMGCFSADLEAVQINVEEES